MFSRCIRILTTFTLALCGLVMMSAGTIALASVTYSPTSGSGVVGTAFSMTLTLSTGSGPLVSSMCSQGTSGLPSGLVFNNDSGGSQSITGTPTTAGTYTVIIEGHNQALGMLSDDGVTCGVTITITITSSSSSSPDSDGTVSGIVTAQSNTLNFAYRGVMNTVLGHMTSTRNCHALIKCISPDESEETTASISDPALRNLAKSMTAKKQATTPKAAQPDYKLWAEGSIIHGDQSFSGDTDSNRYKIWGVTAGIDTNLMEKLQGGMAISLFKDNTKIGADGSYNHGAAVAGTVYTTWEADKNLFIDTLVGYGSLDFTTSRYDSDATSFMSGSRSGQMFFGSLIASYDQKNGALYYAPYVGFDAMSGTLNSYTETGDATYILGYNDVTVSSQGVILGLRGQYDVLMAWGTLSPTGQVQYRHSFTGNFTQKVYYDADASTTYDVSLAGYDQDTVMTAIGLKAASSNGLTGQIEYLHFTSMNGDQANGVKGILFVLF